MVHGSKSVWLALLLLGGNGSAATLGSLSGKAVAGHALAVNVPFTVDAPADRACASAGVRYGGTPVSSTLHVQGHGLKRNLLVTSRTNVNEQPVRVDVRVGCGARAVSRRFVLASTPPAARSAALAERPKTVAFTAPAEPLFPPPVQEPEPASREELQQAQAQAATAVAQLAAARKELAAVLDVERRTSQTLIAADHQVRDAQAEAARMRLLLQLLAGAVLVGAAALAWFEVQRVLAARAGAELRKMPA